MSDSPDYRTGFLRTPSEFHFPGDPINCRIVFLEPVIEHELVSFILPKEAGDGFAVSESEVDDDFCRVHDKSIHIHSSVHIVGDHWDAKPNSRKVVEFRKFCIHD